MQSEAWPYFSRWLYWISSVLLTHGVGSICGSEDVFSAIMLSGAVQMVSLLSIGTLHLACDTGGMVGSILMVYSPLRLPILSKEFGYIAVSCSLSVIDGTYRFMKYWLLLCTEATLSLSQPWSCPWESCWHWSCLLAIHSVSLSIGLWPVVVSLWYFSAICLPDRTVFYPLFSLHFAERTEFCMCYLSANFS